MSAAATSTEPFVITRVLNAPRKLVWAAFPRPAGPSQEHP
jgi:uncharacterized protein YndB with AHSA1/START domain